MSPFEMVVAIVAIGCFTGMVTQALDKIFGNKAKAKEQELRLKQKHVEMVEERSRHLEAELIEARRQNEQLVKQVEWHGKLLETQDQMLKRLGPPPGAEAALPERTAAR